MTAKGKSYSDRDTKPILLQLTKEVFARKEYVLEHMTGEYCRMNDKNIEIIRLPIGHSELNPIELIWAQVKNEVARRNTKFNVSTVQQLTATALCNVNKENWKACIQHVEKVNFTNLQTLLL